MISIFERVQNIVGEGENAGLQAFSPFPKMISKGFFLMFIKSLDYCGIDLRSERSEYILVLR